MEKAIKLKLEYEEQFFNFSSELFLESMRKGFEDNIDATLEGAVKLLNRKLSPSAQDPEILQSAFEIFASETSADYKRGVDYGLECVKEKIRECLNIPEWVVLEDDRMACKADKVSEEDLDRNILKLKEELKIIRISSAELKDELNEADAVIKMLEQADRLPCSMIPEIN